MRNWYVRLLHGDLGTSILLGQGVFEAVVSRLPISLALAAYALVFSIFIGFSTGIIAALRHNTWIDQLCMGLALIGISLPNFWLGLMFIVLFGVHLGWFPTGGYVPFTQDPWRWLVTATLPALSLALMQVGLLARIIRSTMLEVIGQDYIRTARASGVPYPRIVYRHAMKNMMIPVITVIGIIVSLLVSGSVVIETVFSIPGIGRLIGSAILRRDYPVIQGGLLISAFLLVLINLAVDIFYAYFNPRVRFDR
jgi:peptide/nickel transport system permease protein